MKWKIKIETDDLSDGKVIDLLSEHRNDMLKHSPPESVHAININSLNATELQKSGLTFWRATCDGHFAACAGLRRLDEKSAEIKSMKTSNNFVGRGLASALLKHILKTAGTQGYKILYLETGSMDAFIPA